MEQRRFLAAGRSATLATLATDGRPRLVPICFVVAADDASGRPRLYSPLDEKPKRTDDPRALARVRDLGLCLISVRRLDTGETRNGAPH